VTKLERRKKPIAPYSGGKRRGAAGEKKKRNEYLREEKVKASNLTKCWGRGGEPQCDLSKKGGGKMFQGKGKERVCGPQIKGREKRKAVNVTGEDAHSTFYGKGRGGKGGERKGWRR